MVVETLILFVGVIARYVVHRPLVWSDELASTIFLWLGMLGAALAIRRSENLRMNTVVNRLPGTLRALAEPFTLAVTLAFVVMLLPAAIEHVKIEAIVITPTLEISSSWRAAAMPAGLVLMALFVVVRMARQPLRSMLVMLAAVVAGVLRLLPGAPVSAGPRPRQSRRLLPRRGPAHGLRRLADRVLVRRGDLRVSRARDAHADIGGRRAARSGDVQPDPAVDSAVRLSRLSARNHRHGRAT